MAYYPENLADNVRSATAGSVWRGTLSATETRAVPDVSGHRRYASSVCAMSVVSLLGFIGVACGDDGQKVPTIVEEPPPLSMGHDELPEGARGVIGVVFDFETGAPIEGAVVSSDPDTETVTSNARGEYALLAGLDVGEVYTITATAEGYLTGDGAAYALAEGTARADIPLVPLEVASALHPKPSAVVLTRHKRVATIVLENVSSEALAWQLKSAPDWLGYYSSSRLVYQGNPDVIDLWVEGERLEGVPESDVESLLLLEDDNGREVRIALRARVLDPARLELVSVGPPGFAVTSGEVATVDVKVFYDARPVEGERVTCQVGTQAPFVEVDLSAMTDADGVARCSFRPLAATAAGPWEVRVGLSGYLDVPTVSYSLDVAP